MSILAFGKDGYPPPPPPPDLRLGPATGHIKRVTLSIIHRSDHCPDDLRETLDALEAARWDLAKLPPRELEVVYAEVDGELAISCRDEWAADPQTVEDRWRDLREGKDIQCELCGQHFVRWRFDLKHEGDESRIFKVGGDCLEHYKFRVDGEVTAELGLKRLQEAINRAKRKAEMEQWQEAHPTHEADMDLVRWGFNTASRRFPVEEAVRRHMPLDWDRFYQRRDKTEYAALLKYYEKHSFLTEKRTAWIYEGALPRIDRIRAAKAAFANAVQKVIEVRKFWDKVNGEHGAEFGSRERSMVDYYRRGAIDPETIAASPAAIIAKLRGV